MSIVRNQGGSEKVTINGEKVREKLNLVSEISDIAIPVSTLTTNNYQSVIVGTFFLPKYNIYCCFGDGRTFSLYSSKTGWVKKTNYPSPYTMLGGVVVDNILYILVYTGSNTNMYKYDYSLDTWTSINSLNLGTVSGDRFGGIVYFKNEFYIFIEDRTYKYNLSTGLLTSLATNPHYIIQGYVVAKTNAIYILGGTYNRRVTSFDGVNFTMLTDSTNINIPYTNNGVLVVNDKINIFGVSINGYATGWYIESDNISQFKKYREFTDFKVHHYGNFADRGGKGATIFGGETPIKPANPNNPSYFNENRELEVLIYKEV